MPEIKRVLTDPDLVVHCRSKFSTSTLEFLGTAMYIPWHFKIVGEYDGMPWCTHTSTAAVVLRILNLVFQVNTDSIPWQK